jgi:poly-gamma-glutamate capsule biosynthesis protein CapA/YwtB (metallophosphatase superfamily)
MARGRHRSADRALPIPPSVVMLAALFSVLALAGAFRGLPARPAGRVFQAVRVPSPLPAPLRVVPAPATGTRRGVGGRPAAGPAEPPEFDIVASGDILIHRSLWERALALGHGRYDFRPMFARIRPIVSAAALAICHVETPIGERPPTSYPMFSAPAELADAIAWTGWDVCDTASNHTLDKFQDGVDGTLDELDRVGVRHTGSARSAAESGRILMLDVHGVRLAFLAYTFGTNGMRLPHPWSVNLISASRIASDARRARRLGAQLVVVNLHWGIEHRHEPSAEQAVLASALLGTRTVDLVIGQHVHVVQPVENLRGRYVVFGEGNLISGMTTPDHRDGIMAVVHVRGGRHPAITGVGYVPVYVEYPELRVVPVASTLSRLEQRGSGSSRLAEELRASWVRTIRYAGNRGRVHPIPAVPPEP